MIMKRRVLSVLGLCMGLILMVRLFGGMAFAQEAKDDVPLRLNVEEAFAVALKNSPVIAAAKAQKEAARIAYQRVREAVSEIPEDLITVYDATMAGTGPGGTSFGAKQTYLAERQAETMKDIADAGYIFTVQSVRFETYASYLGVLKAAKLVKVSEQNVARAKAQLELAQNLKRAGMVPYKDVLDAEAGLASAEAGLVSARKGLEVAKLTLNKTLGIDLSQVVEPVASVEFGGKPEEVPSEEQLSDDIEYALKHHFQVFQARENAALADYELELVGDYLTSNTWTYREAFYKAQAAREELRSQEQKAILGIREAHLAIGEAIERITAYQKALTSAEESLRLADLRYRNGLATGLEVMNSQVSLANAESQLASAVYDYYLARARYEFAVGRQFGRE